MSVGESSAEQEQEQQQQEKQQQGCQEVVVAAGKEETRQRVRCEARRSEQRAATTGEVTRSRRGGGGLETGAREVRKGVQFAVRLVRQQVFVPRKVVSLARGVGRRKGSESGGARASKAAAGCRAGSECGLAP
jgi:hypothetical protein